METHLEQSVTILSGDDTREYAESVALLFKSQGFSVRQASPALLEPSPLVIGDPGFPFLGSALLVLILSELMRMELYGIPGLRAVLNKANTAYKGRVHVVLTGDAWIPGLQREQVYLDIRKRSAPTVVNEILRVTGMRQQDSRFPPLNLPSIIQQSIESRLIERYLLEMCALSSRTGVLAFGAILYADTTLEFNALVEHDEHVARIDLAAGPHFDLFGLRDTVLAAHNNPPATNGETTAPARLHSHFMEDFFGDSSVQVHYPSMLLNLIERSKMTHSGLIPLIYLRDDGLLDSLLTLCSVVSQRLRDWRKLEKYSAPDFWKHLGDDLRTTDYPIIEYPAPVDTREAIRIFARSIRYF